MALDEFLPIGHSAFSDGSAFAQVVKLMMAWDSVKDWLFIESHRD